MIEQLIAAGGKRWTKGDMDRIYFNDLHTRLGLKLTYYGTGNISSATLQGEKISNGRARKILSITRAAKFWYDIPSGTFKSYGLTQDQHDAIVSDIEAAM